MAKLPEETCQECGRAIAANAVACLFVGRVVCYRCNQKLERAASQAEHEATAAATPATDNQLRYASELGIEYPPGLNLRQMSDLISAKLRAPAGPWIIERGVGLGIEGAARLPAAELEERIARRDVLARWAWSVLRHHLGANWILRADSGLSPREILPVVNELARSSADVDAVEEQGDGCEPDAHLNACDRRGIEYGTESWYWFQHGGASSRSGIYKRTVALLQVHLLSRANIVR